MNIQTREIHPVTQGSDDWRKLRGSRFTASEAPAALGMSRYVSRADLLHQKATGITKEPDDATQARFDRGHQAERSARPLAEKIIGEELAPLTMTADVDGLALLASMDGITMENDIVWETKLWNQELSEAVKTGDLPEHYTIQMDQQLLVSGASRCLFTCSDGTPERTVHCWYETSPEKVSRLIAGWDQFASDLAAYVPEDRPAPVTPAPMESLPAVVVQVQGALTVGGNLDAFGLALRDFIARIPARPATDQQFADAEAACKALKRAEDALAQAEDGALAQISDVELMRRTVADLKDLARSTRLATEKLVKAEKDARRTEKVMAARRAFDKHVAACQLDIKGVRLNVPMPDFGAAIKGLSSLASIDDKLTDALISSQAEVNTLASRIINNLQTLDSVPAYAHLFADRQELAYKDGETLGLLMQKRVDAEAARIEAERERIRQEEERKAQAAAEAKAEAERARIRAEEQQKAQAEAAEREAAAQRERTLAEAAKPAVTRALEAIEREKEATPGKPLAPAPIAAAPVAAGIAPVAAVGSAADDAPTLTLGAINERLHPISVSAAGLAEFGIEPLATKKAKLYSSAQFHELLQKLTGHLEQVACLANEARQEEAA
jgi:putative phage-type endonuclease